MIGVVTKTMFFDSPKVISATDRATRKVLSKFGAFVRRGAKSSIRKRKRPSLPGMPPSSHTGLLKKMILFGYDTDRYSVVIGPTPLHGAGYKNVLEALEYGGTYARMRTEYLGGRGRKRRVKYMATYRARPFMRPALEKELPKLPAMWRDSVK